MNNRERTLVILTGGVLLATALHSGLGRYRTAVELAEKQVESLQNQISDKQDERLLGSMANNRMANLRLKSLPSDPERAVSVYQKWLTDQVQSSGLASPLVDYVGSQPISKLYRQYAFKVTGSGTLTQATKLLDAFYARDVLHRIRSFSLSPDRNRTGQLQLVLDIDAISLDDAPADRPLPGADKPPGSPLSPAALALLQRNPLGPPNQPPKFAGDPAPKANVGQSLELAPKFDDPEGTGVDIELIGAVPEGLRMERGRIRWTPPAVGTYNLIVKATDQGLPPAATEQRISIDVTVAPPPPPPPAETGPPAFDESRTAFLTGLVRDGTDWQAWINLRTKGKTLKLRVGDEVNVGAVAGKISEINDRHAVIQSGEERRILRPGNSLADAKLEE